jgi:hypothetical protein
VEKTTYICDICGTEYGYRPEGWVSVEVHTDVKLLPVDKVDEVKPAIDAILTVGSGLPLASMITETARRMLAKPVTIIADVCLRCQDGAVFEHVADRLAESIQAQEELFTVPS